MDIKRHLTKLDEKFMRAASQEEEDAIMAQINDLFERHSDMRDELAQHHAEDMLMIAKSLNIQVTLAPIIELLNFKNISKNYFNRSSSWFYQRLNGNEVHGMRCHFTASELSILKQALMDIAKKIEKTADEI